MNDIAVFGLVFFALALTALLFASMTLLPQINRTLNAYENLAQTLDSELGPTLKEVQKVVTGVGELRQIAGQRVAQVGTTVEDVTGSLGKAADSAKRQSSVVGAGLWAGLKTYLAGKDQKGGMREPRTGTQTNGHDTRQIVMDRGEENVGLNR